MKDRLLSTFLGALLGFCIPLLIYVLIFEHITFFVLLPIIPILGVVLGTLIGLFRIIPPLKIRVSLLIFIIIISFTIGFSIVRSTALQKSRESFAVNIANQFPDTIINEIKYYRGNSLNNYPEVKILISSENPFKKMSESYNKVLVDNRRGGTRISISNDRREMNDSDFWLVVDYESDWITQLKEF